MQKDALSFIASCGDGAFDVTLTDPPYNRESRNARSVYDGKVSVGSLGKSALGAKGAGIAWDLTDADIETLTAELLRVTKRWVIVFCALEQLGVYRRAALKAWARAGVWAPDGDEPEPFFAGLWDRNNTGTPQLTGDRPAQGAEGLAIMHAPGSKKRWNGRGSRGIWRFSRSFAKDRHPAQKPADLCDELVRLFTEPGEHVFDPYCGSAAIGVAALKAGRAYTGNDGDPVSVRMAKKNLGIPSLIPSITGGYR